MKDTTITAILIVAFILSQLVIVFGLWGRQPEGCFLKISKLQAQITTLEKKISEIVISDITPLQKRLEELEAASDKYILINKKYVIRPEEWK